MSSASDDDGATGQGADELAPMDFSVLVLSLRASAMMHLGQGRDADGSTPPVDLPLAEHSISTLTMLEEKTRGNLTGEEERLLSQALFDLRVAFEAAAKQQDG